MAAFAGWSRLPWWALLLAAAGLTALVYVSSDNATPTIGAIWFVLLTLLLFGFRWFGRKWQK